MKDERSKIALYDPSGRGGIAQYSFALAEGLAAAGCDVALVTTQGYELASLPRHFTLWFLFKKSRLKSWLSTLAPRSTGASTLTAASVMPGATPPASGLLHRAIDGVKAARLMCVLVKAALLLRWNGTRVVHFQWLMERHADLLFMRLLRWLGLRVVYTVHDVLPHDEYTPENKRFFQELYRHPDALILHSENNRRELLELFDVDRSKLHVIPHGCQTVCFDHFNSTAGGVRVRNGIPDKARVILFFGLIKRYKGLEYLLEAFETISARCHDAVLVIAGTIADRDPATHQHYTGLLAQLAHRRDIRFKDAYVPLDQVGDYFAAADIVVMPYVKASQSGVLLSAYAAGRPVVVTDTGGLGELVRTSGGGIVVPPQDPGAIAEAVLRILDDADLRQQFSLEARTMAETTYSWDRIAARTAVLYDSLVHGVPGPDGFRPAPTQ